MNQEIAVKHDTFLSNYIQTGNSKVIGIGRDVDIVHKDGHTIGGHLEVTESGNVGRDRMFIGTITPKEPYSMEKFVEEHREILGFLSVPVLIIGEDGCVLLVNKAAQKTFGYRESSLQGKNVNLLMQKQHAKKHNQYINNYLTTGKAKIIGSGRVVHVVCKNKNVRQCHLTVSERRKGSHHIFVGILAVLY